MFFVITFILAKDHWIGEHVCWTTLKLGSKSFALATACRALIPRCPRSYSDTFGKAPQVCKISTCSCGGVGEAALYTDQYTEALSQKAAAGALGPSISLFLLLVKLQFYRDLSLEAEWLGSPSKKKVHSLGSCSRVPWLWPGKSSGGVRARSANDHQTLPQNQEGKPLPCKRGGKTTYFLPSSYKHLWIRGRKVDQVWSCRGPWAPFLFLRLPSFQVSTPHPCASVLVLLSGRFKREHSMSPQPLRPEVVMLKDWQKDSERGLGAPELCLGPLQTRLHWLLPVQGAIGQPVLWDDVHETVRRQSEETEHEAISGNDFEIRNWKSLFSIIFLNLRILRLAF